MNKPIERVFTILNILACPMNFCFSKRKGRNSFLWSQFHKQEVVVRNSMVIYNNNSPDCKTRV